MKTENNKRKQYGILFPRNQDFYIYFNQKKNPNFIIIFLINMKINLHFHLDSCQ